MANLAPLDAILRDARYAIRVLGRTPMFTSAAALILALAIAANAAVFSVADAVLLKPLPYAAPERLAIVMAVRSAEGITSEMASQNGRTWEAVRDHADAVEPAVFSTWTTGVNAVMDRAASHVQAQRVGAGFFRVLGVSPLLGREFSADEDRLGGPAAVILSHSLWQSMFRGDPTAVGRAMQIRGEAATVVGVMPAGFRTGQKADVWTPLRPNTTGEGSGENYTIVARLREGTTWPAAQAEMQRVAESVARDVSLALRPLQDGMAGDLRQPLLILWGAVAIVLVVACVNLAGLLLARASGRTREIATRLALGSGRTAVIRQLVIESVVLAAIGGTLGVALGYFALEGLKSLAADAFDIWQPVRIDLRTVAAAAVLALASSAAFGLAPAWNATRLNVYGALTEAGARTIAGGARRWSRKGLVVAQVALAVVLLAGAGLLVRTFAHLQALDPGFDPTNVVTATVSLQDARYGDAARVNRLFTDMLSRLQGAPGIDAAGVALGLPYERLLNLGFRHLTGPDTDKRGRMTNVTYIAGDFFGAMRLSLRAGRTLDARDAAAAPGVVVVSDAFARQYFNGEDPVGQRIAVAGREREIVGLVSDVQVRPGWGDYGPLAAMPLAYIPASQTSDAMLRLVHGWFAPAFAVRTRGDPGAAVSTLKRALAEVDPLLPFARMRNMSDVRAESLAQQRLVMALLATLALAAVLLAAVGVHALIAASVTERTREMGIRMALGATARDALRTLALPGVALAATGVVLGIGGALAFVQLLRGFVWGVQPTDAMTFAATAALLLTVATIASVVPAWRILRVDPARALRQD